MLQSAEAGRGAQALCHAQMHAWTHMPWLVFVHACTVCRQATTQGRGTLGKQHGFTLLFASKPLVQGNRRA